MLASPAPLAWCATLFLRWLLDLLWGGSLASPVPLALRVAFFSCGGCLASYDLASYGVCWPLLSLWPCKLHFFAVAASPPMAWPPMVLLASPALLALRVVTAQTVARTGPARRAFRCLNPPQMAWIRMATPRLDQGVALFGGRLDPYGYSPAGPGRRTFR